MYCSLVSDYAPSNWSFLPEAKCGGEQQSPINIDTQSTTEDESLGAFTFLNFDDKHAIESITNTGHSGLDFLSLVKDWRVFFVFFRSFC